MKGCFAATIAVFFIVAVAPTPHAEYVIYLKGGHYIVADSCTFWNRQGEEESKGEEESALADDCTQGKPEGDIFWSTIDGSFGEVNAEDVYVIFGAKTLASIRAPRATKPLEDYLITNRGESFVNAKIYEVNGTAVYGFKREDLAKINRRAVIEIVPQGEAKSRSGEGLCPGESADFSVSEVALVDGRVAGVVRNLSKTPWKPQIDVEVQVKGKRLGKFQVQDRNVIPPDDSTAFYAPVPARFVKYLARLTDPDAGVRLCYRKQTRPDEGLCAGEPADFSVTDVERRDDHLSGFVTNLSQSAWRPFFEVQVEVKGKPEGKITVTELGDLTPLERNQFYQLVPDRRLLEYIERKDDPDAGVRLCYKKVKVEVGKPTAAQPAIRQPAK